ncbi:MAG: polysaccharide deacetylase family protein [Myxococcaceae bacterium]
MPGPEPTALYAAAGALAAGGLLATGLAGVFHPRSTLFGPTIWRGTSTRTAVAVTFDDGPDPRYTARIARILDAHQARATFFCIGQKLEQHRSFATALQASGHELENHTYRHGTGRDLFSTSRLREDLQRCQELLITLSGRVPRYYRPAVGIRNPHVHAAARSLGLTVVTWTLAARDGVIGLTPRRALRLADRADAGSILALHDGQLHGGPSLREQTVEQLPQLLLRLKERGFIFQTLAELLEG